MHSEDDLLSVIGGIYDAAIDPTLWPEVLATIDNACDAAASMLYTCDTSDTSLGMLTVHNMDDKLLEEFNEYYIRIDPRIKFMERNPTPFIQYDYMHIDEKGIDLDEHYNRLSDYELRYYIGGRVWKSGSMEGHWALQRSSRAGHVQSEDIERYNHLFPHMQRAVQISSRLGNTQLLVGTALDAVERLPQGLVLLDQRGRIIFMNESARNVFSAEDALTTGRDGLSAMRRSDNDRLQKLIASAIAASLGKGFGSGGTMNLIRRYSLRPYSLLVTPVSQREAVFADTRPAVVVLIGNPDATPELPTQQLRRMYGLTKREADIAALIATGANASTSAEKLGIAPRTAQLHLQSVFAKTGTRGQGELVKLLLTSGLAVEARE